MIKLYPKILTLALSISILLSIFLLPTTKVVAEDQTYETKTILATDEAKYIMMVKVEYISYSAYISMEKIYSILEDLTCTNYVSALS